jgi:hypothetical protein
MEIWKVIPSAPCYEASSFGRIRNSRTFHVLSARLRKDGYRDVGLREGQETRLWRKVSQLVGEAFLGPRPFIGAVVAHEDGTRSNDRVENLHWKTQKENHADRERHGRAPKGSRNGSAVLREDDVRRIKALLRLGATQKSLSEQYGVCPSTICHINIKKTWSHIT